MPGTLIVSLDFELFWGMLDVCPLEEYQDHVLGGKKAIPRLLELFRKHGIHATWATVGYLFAENYEELQRFFPAKELLPTYTKENVNTYRAFSGIGTNEAEAPCFYAPGLIRQIAETPGQEIGSQTFSHYYCREAGQTPEQFAADMAAAKAIASAHGYDLTSVVLPRNQCEPEYTQVLQQSGFTAYRDEENDWIHSHLPYGLPLKILRTIDMYFPITGQGGYTPKNEHGIWNLTGSRMFRPIRPHVPLEKWKIRRIKGQMLHAAKNGLTFHLWWHPHNLGVQTEAHLQQLEEIFAYYEELKQVYGMRSLNMGEAARELSGKMGD